MQNLAEHPDTLVQKPDEKDAMMASPWYNIWFKEWNNSTWLMSSFISTLIIGEIYAVVLSIYPNFMISIWLSLGIQSLLYTSLMTFLTLLSLGLISGTLFYTAHLILKSMHHFEDMYHHFTELWFQQTQQYAPILIEQLNDDNIEKITKILEEFPAAEPLVQFLKNDKNAESIHQIIKLLKEIWSQDSMDGQIKILVIHLLTQYVQEDNAKLHINNIWILWEHLQKNPELNLEMMLKVLNKSSLIQALIQHIQTYPNQADIIHHGFVKPEMLTYVHAMENAFPQRSLDERAQSARQLYADNTDALISCQLFNHLHELDENQKAHRMQLLDTIINHTQAQQIKALLIEINTTYPAFFNDDTKTMQILKLFEKSSSPDLNISALAKILIQLDAHQCLELIQTHDIHLKNNLELIHDVLQCYFNLSPQNHTQEKLQSILEIKDTQWGEKEKDDFLKNTKNPPIDSSEKIEQKSNKHLFRKASSVFKAFKPKKDMEKKDTPILEPSAEVQPETSKDAKEQWRLFKDRKTKSTSHITSVQTTVLK